MTSRRHFETTGIAIGLLLIALVLALLWANPWGDADRSAEAAAARVCTELTQNHYDGVSVTTTAEGTKRTEEYYAAGDTRVLTTWKDPSGNLEGRKEQIFKDGVLYTRVTDTNANQYGPVGGVHPGHYHRPGPALSRGDPRRSWWQRWRHCRRVLNRAR